MEKDITAQLQRGEAPDPEFLAAVLSRLGLAKARARLREIHEEKLQVHVAALEAAGDPTDIAAAMGWDRERAEQVGVLGPERDAGSSMHPRSCSE